MPVLTALDIIGIQSYVFASNRLRDVIGASYLVDWATSRAGGLHLDNDHVSPPEIIVAAGGNALLRFATLDAAKEFVLYYSRRLLERTPGLDVAIAHQPYAIGQLTAGLLALQVQLAKAKLERRPHAPQLGLSVMQPCAVTGFPATSQSIDSAWVSSSIAALRNPKTVQAAKERWQEFLPSAAGRTLRFPDVMDQLGRTRGETSLIGVVHVDGNGIGQRIQKWLVSKLEDASMTDKRVIEEYRSWSAALDTLVKTVLRKVTNRLIQRIEPSDDGVYVRGQPNPPRQLDFELETDSDGTICLPFRPILCGGDDLTFVCDVRIALDLATTALRAFESESARIDDLKILGHTTLTACAGVALVTAHAPFSHSYRLCEDLCASAKRAKRTAEPDSQSPNSGSWIDWHVGTIRPDETVDNLRRRQYQEQELTCRPYPLDGNVSPHLSWTWLDGELLGEPSGDTVAQFSFRNPNVWGDRRNKVKTLASLVGNGSSAVREQLEAWNAVDSALRLPKPIDANGFKGERTPLLDAVELLDLHLRLEAPESSPRLQANSAEERA